MVIVLFQEYVRYKITVEAVANVSLRQARHPVFVQNIMKEIAANCDSVS